MIGVIVCHQFVVTGERPHAIVAAIVAGVGISAFELICCCGSVVVEARCISILEFMSVANFATELDRGRIIADLIVLAHADPTLQIQLNGLAGGGDVLVHCVIR